MKFLCMWGLHSYGPWVDAPVTGIRRGFIGDNGLQTINQHRKCIHCGMMKYR